MPRGELIFREKDVPDRLALLLRGEVELSEESEPQVVLRAVAPLGELGSLTGLPRNTTARAVTEVLLLEASTDALTRLFDTQPALGMAFYRSFLEVVGTKVRRDRRRIEDMRHNIIRTQKAMKAAREIVLSSEETSISKPVCDALDDLIENNRRAHYRVVPTPGYEANARFQERAVQVVELSEGYVKLDRAAGFSEGAEVSGVLALPQGELPLSGRIVRTGQDGVLVKLDMMIDEYHRAFTNYVTQLQLLDFVV